MMVANLRLVADSAWLQGEKTGADNKRQINHVLLMPGTTLEVATPAPSYKMLTIVISAHLAILAAILMTRPDIPVSEVTITPMTVSLVNTPSSDEPQIMPQQPEVIEVPRKQEPKAKPARALSELPTKEPAIAKTVTNEPAAQPAMAEAAATESPVKTEQPSRAVEAPAKTEAVAEPVIEPPRFGAAYLNNPAPIYPPLSRRSGEQGRVLLRVLVSESGLAESVQLDSSSGYEKLDRAAIEAVKKWSFIPAKRSNQPVSAYVLVPVKFSLSS